MSETITEKKPPDFYGMGGVARLLERTSPSCRSYAAALYARGVKGILRADNGDYYVTPRGIKAMRAEAARRQARISMGINAPREVKP